MAALLGCGACSFPDVAYQNANGDGGDADAQAFPSDGMATDGDAPDASDADGGMAADASSDGGQFGDAANASDAAGAGDARADAEAGAPGPALGVASTFAILAGTTVTNSGQSSIMGDLGVSPGTAVTGVTPMMITGTIHAGDDVAANAQSALVGAYNELRRAECGTDLTGKDLGGLTLGAGTYCYPSTGANLTGTLILDAKGDASAVFIFQITGALTTTDNARIQLRNAAAHCNVFWQVGSSATIGPVTTFEGNILASTSITLNAGVLVDGRALAESGAVTLDTSDVVVGSCP